MSEEVEEIQEVARPVDTDEFVARLLKQFDEDLENHDNFSSLHEAYGVLEEERDEFFTEVKRRQGDAKHYHVEHEALQIAAVGLRIAIEARWLCREKKRD